MNLRAWIANLVEIITNRWLFQHTMTDRLSQLVEHEVDVRYQVRATETEPEFEYLEGHVPVLLSAPHGAVHTREGKSKEEDEFTAGLVILIAEITGAHAIYARRKSAADPNWDSNVPYKLKLKDIITSNEIQFVLDLHGASEGRDFGIALGTMKGRSCPDQLPGILSRLNSWGFSEVAKNLKDRVDVDGLFTGMGKEGQETITRFVWETLQVPVVQIELNASLRIPRRREDASQETPFAGDRGRILRAIRALCDLVKFAHTQT